MPGRTPHPARDPAGHGACRGLAVDGFPEQSGACEAWGYGIDLWNHGFPWEAHEAWEAVWSAHRHRAPGAAELARGLIQCAAAAVVRGARAGPDIHADIHADIGADTDAAWRRVAERGLARLDAAAARGDDAPLGLDARALATALRAWVAGAGGALPFIEPAPRAPRRPR